MKGTFLFLAMLASLCVATAPATAADKIDPASYICAEFSALNSTSGEPPLFEGLQMDGFAAAKDGIDAADPNVLAGILVEIAGQCATKPADAILPLWQKVRKALDPATDGPWNATKVTCKQLNEDRDTGDGFVVWLDGYNRQKTGKNASILDSQESFDAYFAACKASPEKLMIDVMRELAK